MARRAPARARRASGPRICSGITEAIRNIGVAPGRIVDGNRTRGGPVFSAVIKVFPARVARRSPWHGPCSAAGRARTRPVAKRGDDRAAVWVPGDELDARHLDRRARPDRVRAAGDAADVEGSRRRAELPRVDRRGALRVAREHHRPPPGRQDVLVLRDRSSSSSSRRTGSASCPASARSVGATRPSTASSSTSRSSAAPTPISISRWRWRWCSSRAGSCWAIQEVGVGGMAKELFAPKGDTTGAAQGADDRGVLRGGLPGDHLDPVPPDLLSFRLYGNVFAGENMLETMAAMVPGLGLAAADPVLFHGTARGAGAGDGLHVADGRLHLVDLSPRREAGAVRTLNVCAGRFGA